MRHTHVVIFFLFQTIIISLTGVMAPGPITAVTVGTGTKTPHAGALVAIGHGIVELPLVVLIYYGLGNILSINSVKASIFLLGGLFLLLMGFDMLRSIKTAGHAGNAYSKTPLAAGIFLSIGNVYFLIWWVTIGASLITKAVSFGIFGTIVFALVHWSCDLAWLYFLSAAAYKGGKIIGIRFQKIVFALCGTFLLVFSLLFLTDAVRIWFR